jgi:hypothetical protein
VAGRDRVKGQGNAALGEGFVPHRPIETHSVVSQKIATVERREGAPARKGRRGAFAEVPQVTRAVSALRSLTM